MKEKGVKAKRIKKKVREGRGRLAAAAAAVVAQCREAVHSVW